MERVENKLFTSGSLEKVEFVQPLAVLSSMKQTALVVEVSGENGSFECLYRPEKGISLSLDPRVPKPQELYRDVAYHKVDQILGWGISVPVVPWQLDKEDKGVLRPYWKSVDKMEFYHFKKDIFFNKPRLLAASSCFRLRLWRSRQSK